MSQRATFLLGVVLIAVLSASIVATIDLLGSAHSTSEFFVGVEFAYSDNVDDLKDLVDKVKDHTNLFVIGSVNMTFNRTALDESCGYIYDADSISSSYLQRQFSIGNLVPQFMKHYFGFMRRDRN
jgi:hypothetical protein